MRASVSATSHSQRRTFVIRMCPRTYYSGPIVAVPSSFGPLSGFDVKPVDLWGELSSLEQMPTRCLPLISSEAAFVLDDGNRLMRIIPSKGQTAIARRGDVADFSVRRLLNADQLALRTSQLIRHLTRVGAYVFCCRHGLSRVFLGAPRIRGRDLDLLSYRVNLLPFSECAVTSRYRRRVSFGALNALYVSWLYARRGPLSAVLKAIKTSAAAGAHLSRAADVVADVGWSPILNNLQAWIHETRQDPVVMAVPSRFGTSERLAAQLARRLRALALPVSLDVRSLRRRGGHTAMKDINDWDGRHEASGSLFTTVNGLTIRRPVILADDVVTSGASMRTCARLLRGRGATQICGAVISGAPEDAPLNWFRTCRTRR